MEINYYVCLTSVHFTGCDVKNEKNFFSIKKLFLKILQYSQENTCVGVSL